MAWAVTSGAETCKDDLACRENPGAQEVSEVIYYLVARHAHGEALELAKLVPRDNGAELWWGICKRCDPRRPVKRAALLSNVIQQKAVTIEELGRALDKWCAKVKLCEGRTNTQPQDDLQMTIAQNTCPETLRRYPELNSAWLIASEQMEAEIRAHLESRKPQPMDIDDYEKCGRDDIDAMGQKGKGMGKGCYRCGGHHFARECPQSQKGKGKDITAGSYTCGGDHLARYCDMVWRQGKGKGPEQYGAYCWKRGKYGGDGTNCWGSKGKEKGKTRGKPAWSFGQAANKGEWVAQEEGWQEDCDEVSGALEDFRGVRAGKDHFSNITIDSGAAVCVAPPSWFPQYKTQQSAGSEMGARYVTASGNRVRNEGEKRTKIRTEAGRAGQMAFQVAQVANPICAVSKICENGHAVASDEDGSYVKRQKSGKVILLKKERGVYVMDAAMAHHWVWESNDNGQHFAIADQQFGDGGMDCRRHAKAQL